MGFFTSAADSSVPTAQPASSEQVAPTVEVSGVTERHWADDERIIKALIDSELLSDEVSVRLFMASCKLEPTEAYKQFVSNFGSGCDVISRVVDKLTDIKELFENMGTTIVDAITSAEHEKAADEFAAAEAHKAYLEQELKLAQDMANQAAADVDAARAAASALFTRFTAGQVVPAIELQAAAEAITAADAAKAKADECVTIRKNDADSFEMPPPPAQPDFPKWNIAASFVDSMSCVPNTFAFAPNNMRFIESNKIEECIKTANDTFSTHTLEDDPDTKQELIAASNTMADRVIGDCMHCLQTKKVAQVTKLVESASRCVKWGRFVGDESRKDHLVRLISKLHSLREIDAYNRRKAEIMAQ